MSVYSTVKYIHCLCGWVGVGVGVGDCVCVALSKGQ